MSNINFDVVTEEISVSVDPPKETIVALAHDQGPAGPRGHKGDTGPRGERGEDGISIDIKGTLDNEGLLPKHPTAKRGDAYIVKGDLHVYNGSIWNNVGRIQGTQGERGLKGDTGPKGERGSVGAKGDKGEPGDATINDALVSSSQTWSSQKISEFAVEQGDITWTEVKGVNPSVEFTKEGHMKEVEIFGNTWQDDKDGKNLFDGEFELGQYESSGLEIQNDNMVRNKNKFIPIKPNTQYTLSATKGGESLRYMTFEYDEKKKGIQTLATKTFRTHANARYLNFEIMSLVDDGVKIQLEEGLEATSYEPYHKADLTDIRHVGELQEDGRYKIEVESSTLPKNISPNDFKTSSYRDGFKNKDGFIEVDLINEWQSTLTAPSKTIKPNKKYTLVVNIKENTISSDRFELNSIVKEETQFSNQVWINRGETGVKKILMTSHDEVYKSSGMLRMVSNPRNIGKLVFNYAIYEGNLTDEELPKYETSKQTLLLPCQLSKVGDVQDRLYWNGKKYVVEKNVNEYHIGSEGSLNSYKIIPEFSVIGFYNTLSHNKWKTNIYDEYTNFTKEKQSFPGRVEKDIISFTTLDNMIKFAILKSNLETQDIDGLKKYLQSNPLIIYRVLKEPKLIETDITEQIFPSTFKDKTHFFVKGGKLDGEIKGKVPVDAGKAIRALTERNQELIIKTLTLGEQANTLGLENKELKETNETQDNMIDTTMLATDEMFGIIEEILPEVAKLIEEGSKMVNLYIAMIQRGLKTIDQIPTRYRVKVQEILDTLEN